MTTSVGGTAAPKTLPLGTLVLLGAEGTTGSAMGLSMAVTALVALVVSTRVTTTSRV
jgi:hypothetical protein